MKLKRLQNIRQKLNDNVSLPYEWRVIFQELLDEAKVEYPLSSGLLEQGALQRVRQEGKIPAIKWYRQQTDCGLRDAKNEVERMMERHGVEARAYNMSGRREPITPHRAEQYLGRSVGQSTKRPGKNKPKRKIREKLRLRHRVAPKSKKLKKGANLS